MKLKNKVGFTLIELLVVVLIIGILAAVALPQYQKAVEKAKATEAITMLKAAYEAGKVSYLENGEWPHAMDKLNIQIPWTENTAFYQLGDFGRPLSNQDWSIQFQRGQKNKGIGVVRISGKYQGAGFYMFFAHGNRNMPLNQLICVEIHRGNLAYYNFGATTGDYCQKIMNGSSFFIGDGNNYWSVL